MQTENNINGVSAAESAGRTTNNHRSALDRNPLASGQIQAVMSIAGPEWKGMIMVGKCTGQRLHDIAKLRWHDIDEQEGVIRFLTRKSSRLAKVAITPPLAEYLATLQKPQNADSPIFPKAYAVTLRNPGALHHEFLTMQKKAKLKPWNFYLLRITFFKNLQLRGLPIMTIRQILATHSRI